MISSQATLWIAIGTLAVGAVLSTLFFCLREMSRAALEELAATRDGESGARRIQRIVDDVDGHSAAVALPRIVCNMITAVAAVVWVGGLDGDSKPVVADLIIGVGASSLLIWVLGMVVPHSIAAHVPEGTVYAWSWLIRLCYIVQKPLTGVVRFSDEVVRRLAGQTPSTEGEQIQAELMSVVEDARHEGQFDEVERDMIEAVVSFRGTTVEQIMTPRTEVEALQLTNNLGELTKFIKSSRHSRIPVYEGGMDQIVGMFYIKDLMRWLAGEGTRGAGKPFELKSILRPALFVPETKTVRELLQELIDKKVHIAMVADEYGGTSGLVTLEDVVEEVFGEIQDEYELTEDETPEVKVDSEARAAEIDARAYIHDANAELKPLGVTLPTGEDYDTVGGLIVTTLGRIPEVGESMMIEGATVHIVEAEPTRVARVRLEVKAVEVEPPAAGEVTINETKPEAVEQ